MRSAVKRNRRLSWRVFTLLLICTLLATMGCSDSKTGTQTPEQILKMTDAELAETFAGVELIEEGGEYAVHQEVYENWKPESGEKQVTSPMRCGITVLIEGAEEEPETAAMCLTKRYIHFMMNPKLFSGGTFLITAYRNLSIEVFEPGDLPEKYSIHAESEPKNDPYSSMKIWYVVPKVELKYIGQMNGVISDGDWTNETGTGEGYILLLRYIESSGNYSLTCLYGE